MGWKKGKTNVTKVQKKNYAVPQQDRLIAFLEFVLRFSAVSVVFCLAVASLLFVRCVTLALTSESYFDLVHET